MAPHLKLTTREAFTKIRAHAQIVNQTLSQSVPPTVITSINGFAKVFLGTLIERAREIQAQQVEAAERSLPTPPHNADSRPSSAATEVVLVRTEGDRPGEALLLPDSPFTNDLRKEAPLRAKDNELGPLLPDHVREAFRRFRRDGEGGGAGVEGRSVGLAQAGARATRLKGRRLFR